MTGRVTANISVPKSDLVSLKCLIEFYRTTTGTLPPGDIGLGALVEPPSNLPADAKWRKMLAKIPEDPWGRPYSYILDSDLPGGYGIFSRGLDGVSRTVGNDPDDFNSWSPKMCGIDLNPISSMPWLVPGIVLSGILIFCLGMRAGRRRNLANNLEESTSAKPPTEATHPSPVPHLDDAKLQ